MLAISDGENDTLNYPRMDDPKLITSIPIYLFFSAGENGGQRGQCFYFMDGGGRKLETVWWYKNCRSFYPRVIKGFQRHMAKLSTRQFVYTSPLTQNHQVNTGQFILSLAVQITQWQQVELINNNNWWLSQLPLCPVFAMLCDSLTRLLSSHRFWWRGLRFNLKFLLCTFAMFYHYKIIFLTQKR